MPVRYIDAHCHVQFGAFDADREELVGRMKERGVVGIVVGCDRESSKAAVELAEKHEHLFASVGLHPNHEPDEPYDRAYYRQLAAHPKVVAIGECGLDYFRPVVVDEMLKKKQQVLLHEQISLATELAKPLIIHSRPSKGTYDAYHDLIAILQHAKTRQPNVWTTASTKGQSNYSGLRGDIHFFVGGIEEMHELTALGFTVSFTAVITFAREYDSVIRAVPDGSLLAETDAPYVPPMNREKGSRNDPLAVEDVVAKLAEIRGEEVEKLRERVLANSQRLFMILGPQPPDLKV